MDIEIKYDDRELQRAINRLIAAGGDMRAAMREVAGHLADSVADSFDREATPEGAPWKPLKPKTVRERQRRRYAAGPILERSGDLARSILADHDKTSAVAGTNLIYAATHHFGDASRGIPARPFLGLTDEHKGMILDAIQRHFEAALP